MYSTSSENLEKVIKNAGKIAMEFGGNQVGTEHILYGLTMVRVYGSKVIIGVWCYIC